MHSNDADANDVRRRAKDYWCSHHNLSGRVTREGHEHRWELAQYILTEFNPTSVLEFGCGSGRNLAVLRELGDVGLYLAGIDGNPVSVESGQSWHPTLTLTHGDENTLFLRPDAEYDVAFTVSVLDHIPDPYWREVYDDLKRVARKAVVLLEPVRWVYPDFSARDTVEHDFTTDTPTTDYTWAHDYLGHDPALKVVRRLPLALGPTWQAFGDCYHLMEARL